MNIKLSPIQLSKKLLTACLSPNPSLRCRLLMLTSGLLLGTLLVIGVMVIYFVSENEQQTWQGRQSEAARYASEIVASFLERTENALVMVSLLEDDELVAEPKIMDDLLEQSPALLELIRLGKKGQVLASSYRDTPLLANLFTIPQSRWFLESLAGHLYLGDVQISSDSKPYLIIALPAKGGGVVAARLDMDILWQVVAHLRFGKTGQAYVVNQAGAVIAHTDPNVPVARTTLEDRPELESIMGADNRNWTGTYRNFEGEKVVGVTVAVPGTSWVVVTELPYREAFATTQTALLLFGGGMIVLGGLVLLVMQRLLRQVILDPIDQLRIGAERIGEDDLSYRLDLRQQDEIGALATAFNQMADHLYAQQTQLKQYNTQLEQLYQTSLNLTASLDLKSVLDLIQESTFKLIPTIEDTHIFLYQSGQIEFVASLWADGRKDFLIAKPRPGGLTFTVAEQGRMVIVPDIQSDQFYPNPPPAWIGALIGVPLKIGQRVVGVMNVAYTQPHQFQESEVRVLRLMGDQAAIAIESARLYERVQQELTDRKRAEEALRTLNQELESHVVARTVALTETNNDLLGEIEARTMAEKQVKASLHEKEVLLKEIHHRVKNNLQIISSLLRLQSNYIEDQQVAEALNDSRHRVRSMALIHEKLYQSENLAQIDIGEYVRELVTYLFQSHNAASRKITLNFQADDIFLEVDTAVPCGLIVNELVSNTFKHAFPDSRTGEITIRVQPGNNHHVTLTVADNGIGLPPEFYFRGTESLGLQLVDTLVEQLDGTIELNNAQGTEFRIKFPLEDTAIS